eukprot:gene16043-17665_t
MFRPGSSDNMILGRIAFHLSGICWLFGIKIETEGRDIIDNVKKPAIFMCNHQSSLDVLLIVKEAPRRTATLAKKELLKIPIFGTAIWLCGTLFIDRKAGSETITAMKNIGIKMKKDKTNVWIFPEGTRTQVDGIADFKKGGFHLAVQAQIPIVPVVISNCRNFLDISNRFFGRGTMRARVLPPIETEGMTKDDVPELTERCHSVMAKEYNLIMEQHKEEYSNLKTLHSKNKQE